MKGVCAHLGCHLDSYMDFDAHKLGLHTAKMTSDLLSSCPSGAVRTLEKCDRVIKNRGLGFLAVAVLLDCNCGGLAAFSDAFLGSTWSSWTPLGLNLEALVRFLGPTWSLLGASWTSLGLNLALVRADVDSKMAFGVPAWLPYRQNDLQFDLQLLFQSVRHLQLALQLPFQTAPELLKV